MEIMLFGWSAVYSGEFRGGRYQLISINRHYDFLLCVLLGDQDRLLLLLVRSWGVG